MAPRWTASADKHGVDRLDQMYAIVNANFVHELPGEGPPGGQVILYIGPEHSQTEREIEVLVSVYADGREATIFHAMPLGPKFRTYREETS